MRSTATLAGIVHVEGLGPDHKADLSVEPVAPDVEHVRARFRFAGRAPTGPVTISWCVPARDVHGHWAPIAGQRRGNDADWDIRYEARSNSGAPVHCLHSYCGRNRLTFAVSDTYGPVQLRAGLATGEGVFRCAVVLFLEPPSGASYEVVLRLDARDIPFAECLEDVQRWWATMPEHTSIPTQPLARLPVYSTWYGFFRDFDAYKVEEECRLAYALGCATVAVDDGWQTDDRGLECAHCGAWTVARGKIEDMKAHVARVHAIGMKYVLWYSLPHMSSASPEFRRFEGKYLDYDPRSDLWTVDPRYPDVREHLTERLVRAMREWDLDGFRLDFIDGIRSTAASATHSTAPGRDAESLYVAVDRLLSDIGNSVRSIKPNAFLELRHASIGPVMRKHALMLRAAECPQDSLTNRLNVVDMRLIAGRTAVHSDMLTWSHDEPVESAALQFANVLFAVPQLSVRLGGLPQTHTEMIRFYLGFWLENRDILLDAAILPEHSEGLCSSLWARTPEKQIVACYSTSLASLRAADVATSLVVNGTGTDGLVLASDQPLGPVDIVVRDCRGYVLEERRIDIDGRLHELRVPNAGIAVISRR